MEHRHIVGPEQIQRFDKHAAFADERAVYPRVHGQFSPGQEQREQALVRFGGRPREKAWPHSRHQHRGVAGDHAQTVPALDQRGFIGAPNHQVIERDQRRQMQVIAGLGKRTIGGGEFSEVQWTSSDSYCSTKRRKSPSSRFFLSPV